jgi:endonuclease G
MVIRLPLTTENQIQELGSVKITRKINSMKRLFAILSLVLLAAEAQAWEQLPPNPIAQCQAQAPWGYPKTAKAGVAICRQSYVTLNDTAAKIPVWVSYTLTPQNALGCVKRSNAFAPDQSLPKGSRAELSDYAKSGYDIGHVAPNGDMSFNERAEKESFLLTNMYPQLPGLNRGIWKLLETATRGWAVQRGHPIVVYVGAIYGPSDKTIGANAVVVPHMFYKIVTDTVTGEVMAFAFKHEGGQGNDLTKLRVSVDAIEKASGVAFSFPANANEVPGGQIWAVDYGALTNAKRVKCKGAVDE